MKQNWEIRERKVKRKEAGFEPTNHLQAFPRGIEGLFVPEQAGYLFWLEELSNATSDLNK